MLKVKGILAIGIHKIRDLKSEIADYKQNGQKNLAGYYEWSIFDITELIAELLDVSAYTITKLVESDIVTELDKNIEPPFDILGNNILQKAIKSFKTKLPPHDLTFHHETGGD